MSSIIERIDADIKDAMRARDTGRLSLLRGVRSVVKNFLIDRQGDGEISEEEMTQILRKQVKQREDSIESFRKGGREDLVEKENQELEWLLAYLPQPLSTEEVEKLVREAIAEVGNGGEVGKAQMGQVMKAVQQKAAGRADGKTLSQEVQRQLG